MILYQLTRCFPGARSLSGQPLEVLPTCVPKRLQEVADSVRLAEQDLQEVTDAIIFVSSQKATPIGQ